MLDAEKGKPIPFASVFLSNTSIGTKADDVGHFELSIPSGRFDLVVSSIGYETHSQTIQSADVNQLLTIKLKLREEKMEDVVVEPFEKDGWTRWGNFFLENFVGNSDYASQCVIKNTKLIKFRNSKKDHQLTAYAFEPLEIENRALGYHISYQLENFSYDYNTHLLLIIGYPFFQDLPAGNARKKKWAKARAETYYGSMMHFMRSLYRNTITLEGFEVHNLKKIPNAEKARVKEKMKLLYNSSQQVEIGTQTKSPDSSSYYNEVLKKPDYFDVVSKTTLSGDSIAYAVNTTTAGLEFENYLLITYLKHLAPKDYQRVMNSGTSMTSQITLINHTAIEVQANGNYFNPADLVSSGYWAWSEKVSRMLPFDYQPPIKSAAEKNKQDSSQ